MNEAKPDNTNPGPAMPRLAAAAPPPEQVAPRSELPPRRVWLVRLFQRYAVRYVRRYFHALRLSRSGSAFPPHGNEPLLIVLNHPSWWDPMIGTVLSSLMPEREHFAAIDAAAIERYPFFKKLGFVGVDSRSLRGAAQFLRTGAAILSSPNRVFWVTAQGEFSDVRARPLTLKAGVGHLAARLPRGVILPIAVEYAFWTERTPEALVRVGEPLSVSERQGSTAAEWLALIEDALTRNLDVLNAETMARDPAKFITLLTGRTGVGGAYDLWRRFRAFCRGERFDPAHEAVMREKRS